MAVSAGTRRVIASDPGAWVPIADRIQTRRLFLMQVAAGSSAVYLYIGQGTPNTNDALLFAALDTVELLEGNLGPFYIKPTTGGVAVVVVLEG